MDSPHQQHSNTSPSRPYRPAIINPEPHMQAGGFSFPPQARTPDATPLHGSSGMPLSIEPAKKKRGRPRNTDISLRLSPSIAQYSAGGTSAGTSDRPLKKNRGRPSKKQLEALGFVRGVGFTPHVITARAGEDVASKIYTFSQEGPGTVCILSANGAIGTATLSQPTHPSGTVTYEGRYEIISLSGILLFHDDNGNDSRSGGLSVSLANPEGHVFGGGVAGLLRAAGPVQVIVGSFIVDGKNSSSSALKSGKKSSSSVPESGKQSSSSAPESGKQPSSSAPESGKKSSSSAPESVPSSAAPSPQVLNWSSPLSYNSTSQGGSTNLTGENASNPMNRGPGA